MSDSNALLQALVEWARAEMWARAHCLHIHFRAEGEPTYSPVLACADDAREYAFAALRKFEEEP